MSTFIVTTERGDFLISTNNDMLLKYYMSAETSIDKLENTRMAKQLIEDRYNKLDLINILIGE